MHLRLKRFAGVEKQSMPFCHDIVTDNTPLSGSRLVIEELPVVIICASCRSEVELPDSQRLCCPRYRTVSSSCVRSLGPLYRPELSANFRPIRPSPDQPRWE